jgi:DNA-binding protein H-NS
MYTWPELLAHLQHLQKTVVKHQGDKRKALERRIAELQAQARQMSKRELAAAEHTTNKHIRSSRSDRRAAHR